MTNKCLLACVNYLPICLTYAKEHLPWFELQEVLEVESGCDSGEEVAV